MSRQFLTINLNPFHNFQKTYASTGSFLEVFPPLIYLIMHSPDERKLLEFILKVSILHIFPYKKRCFVPKVSEC